jgi:hypothetical protein
MPVVIVLCLVFALAGFFGGRMSGPEAAAETQGPAKSGGPGAGVSSRGDGDGKGDKDKSATAKGERRSGSGSSGSNSVPESFRAYLASLKDQNLVLADGEEREVVAADLAQLSQLMGSLSRADTADVAELKEVLTTLEEPIDEETEALKTLLLPALLGREVELRGAAALDEMVEKNAEEEDDIFSDALPAMAYTLAKQNAAEAERWYKTFMVRPDAEEFSIDTDELKALIEKGKKAGK